MKKMHLLWNKYKELILYVVFGVITTLVNLGSFYLFNKLSDTKSWYLIANVIAWFIAVIFAYVVNKLFVFESKSWKLDVIGREMISFFAARVLSFLVEEGGLFLFVDLLHFNRFQMSLLGFTIGGKMIAKLVLAVIVVILNYFFSKLVIFKKKDDALPINSK